MEGTDRKWSSLTHEGTNDQQSSLDFYFNFPKFKTRAKKQRRAKFARRTQKTNIAAKCSEEIFNANLIFVIVFILVGEASAEMNITSVDLLFNKTFILFHVK